MARSVVIYFDESGFDAKSPLSLVGGVAFSRSDISDEISARLEDVIHHPHLSSTMSVDSLAKQGFHYKNDSMDVRNHFIDLISQIDYRAYIAFTKKTDLDTSLMMYAQILLPALLYYRDFENIILRFEENQQMNKLYPALVDDATQKINRQKGSKVNPEVEIVSKSDRALGVIDYLLALQREHILALNEEARAGDYRTRLYRRVLPNIAIELDFDTQTFSNRRNRRFMR